MIPYAGHFVPVGYSLGRSLNPAETTTWQDSYPLNKENPHESGCRTLIHPIRLVLPASLLARQHSKISC